jgi:GalNAc-alpha-(1->4)-GalNAc-alpha-(1->3)-diNAcBac-PP-undecaprenol alpha-1,4-N-acetyl-D-galactosaminyltransferase
MNKKIAFLIPVIIPGGMERVMVDLINYCANHKNDELHIILYGKNLDLFYSLSDKVVIHRNKMKYNDKARLIYAIKTLAYLRKEVKSIHPDIILSFGEIWNSFVLLSLFGLAYTIYIEDHCPPNETFGWWHEALRKWLYPRAEGLIFLTHKAQEIYSKKYRIKFSEVIANPIRDIKIDANRGRENIVVCVGRLITRKHHDRLIKIFADINNPDWKLMIVGGDAVKQENHSKLQQLIYSLNMADKIILTGTQNNVDDYLLRSKIFALTSSSEGFPLVIGEAMSAGLPVVAYDCITGPSEMINDGENGFLVPLFDDIAFMERLKYLMDNDDKREKMGIAAKESIKKINPGIICEKYYKCITR